MSFAKDPAGALYVMDAPKGIDRIVNNRLVNINQDLDLFSMSASGRDRWFQQWQRDFSIRCRNSNNNRSQA